MSGIIYCLSDALPSPPVLRNSDSVPSSSAPIMSRRKYVHRWGEWGSGIFLTLELRQDRIFQSSCTSVYFNRINCKTSFRIGIVINQLEDIVLCQHRHQPITRHHSYQHRHQSIGRHYFVSTSPSTNHKISLYVKIAINPSQDIIKCQHRHWPIRRHHSGSASPSTNGKTSFRVGIAINQSEVIVSFV